MNDKWNNIIAKKKISVALSEITDDGMGVWTWGLRISNLRITSLTTLSTPYAL